MIGFVLKHQKFVLKHQKAHNDSWIAEQFKATSKTKISKKNALPVTERHVMPAEDATSKPYNNETKN